MNNETLVSIVIPTWQGDFLLEKTLSSVVNQTYRNFHVIVVDNGVIDTKTKVLCEKKWGFSIQYLSFKRQLGYAGAVNMGVRSATTPLVLVMNNDNLMHEECLQKLVSRALSETDKTIISANVHRPDFLSPEEYSYSIWGRHIKEDKRNKSDQIFHPDGSAFLFHREKYLEPYISHYFIYQEDVYLGFLALLIGGKTLIEKSAKVATFDGGSTKRIRYKTAYYTERNRIWNYFLFLTWKNFLFLSPALFIDLLIKFIFGRHRMAKIHSYGSIVFDLPKILKWRSFVQKKRLVSDSEIFEQLSFQYMDSNKAIQNMILNGLFYGLTYFVRPRL
ncbi:MAG: glycosyltransferase [Oligoflexia bacterium]|nr:glycosyltransferase [Oligoflexia bacterium]